MSHPDAGRVKWWRKQLRAETAPPVLLWWWSAVDSDVVLDGHDRLLAASLEDADVGFLRLDRVAEAASDPGRTSRIEEAANEVLERSALSGRRKPTASECHRVELANRLLLEAHTPTLFPTRTVAAVGHLSRERWKAEVAEVVAATGADLRDMVDDP